MIHDDPCSFSNIPVFVVIAKMQEPEAGGQLVGFAEAKLVQNDALGKVGGDVLGRWARPRELDMRIEESDILIYSAHAEKGYQCDP